MPHFDIIHNLYITAGETDEANFILEPEVDSDDEEDEDEQHKSMIQMQGDNTLRDNFKMLQKGEGKQKNNPPPKSAAALKAERRLVYVSLSPGVHCKKLSYQFVVNFMCLKRCLTIMSLNFINKD